MYFRNEFEKVKVDFGTTKKFEGSLNPNTAAFLVKICVLRDKFGKVRNCILKNL